MLNAYKKYWQNYVNFEGRSSRSDFWWVALVHFLISFVFGIFSGIMTATVSYDYSYGTPEFGPGFWIITVFSFVWGLANFLPGLALSVRRLRDAGYHWAFILLPLIIVIPILGWFLGWVTWVVLIVLFCQPSKPETAFQSPYPGYTGGPQVPPYTDPNQQTQAYTQPNPSQNQPYVDPNQQAQAYTQSNLGQSQAYVDPNQQAQVSVQSNQTQPQAYTEPTPSVAPAQPQVQVAPVPSAAPIQSQSTPAEPVQEEVGQESSFDFSGEPVAQSNPAPEAVNSTDQQSNFDQAISSDDNGNDSAFL